MRRLALTSWSLNRALTSGTLTLTDLPAHARAHGIGTIEICHFHLPSTDESYLDELRTAIAAAEVELFSILIDTGDIANADEQRRAEDIKLVEHWMQVASTLGAGQVRIIAGNAPPEDEAALQRSIAALGQLAERARSLNLRILTENFRPLASTATNCNQILDALDGAVGLCADIGNFSAASRVAEFSAVIARAESVHAKASYDSAGTLQPDQLQQCLAASTTANFSGPFTLVYDSGPNEWQGIEALKTVVAPYTQ